MRSTYQITEGDKPVEYSKRRSFPFSWITRKLSLMKYLPLVLLFGALGIYACSTSKSAAESTESSEHLAEASQESLPLKAFLRRVPGVQVTGSGENVQVRVRGLSTLTGDPSPLFVLDGVEVGNSYQDVAFLDGNQIDKIRVLKDATTTSRYGFRGSNGVIVIKTKK